MTNSIDLTGVDPCIQNRLACGFIELTGKLLGQRPKESLTAVVDSKIICLSCLVRMFDFD